MNDNDPRLLMGRAACSHAARVLARYAAWKLVKVPADYGPPFAGCLENETTALLITITEGPLAPAVAAITGALRETRSNVMIIGAPVGTDGLPETALGLWHPGTVVWHAPLLPWLSVGRSMWLVPATDGRRHWRNPGFDLGARHLRPAMLPWTADAERRAGFARAGRALAEVAT